MFFAWPIYCRFHNPYSPRRTTGPSTQHPARAFSRKGGGIKPTTRPSPETHSHHPNRVPATLDPTSPHQAPSRRPGAPPHPAQQRGNVRRSRNQQTPTARASASATGCRAAGSPPAVSFGVGCERVARARTKRRGLAASVVSWLRLRLRLRLRHVVGTGCARAGGTLASHVFGSETSVRGGFWRGLVSWWGDEWWAGAQWLDHGLAGVD
jgi:hypothetical protein